MKISKEFKIGAFVVIVLVVSFFVINYLRGVDIFDKEIELSSRYANLEGLVASAPVNIKGYKAGKVTEVVYDTAAGDFVVTCSISKDFAIPSDSKMTIYGVDIMGGKGIRIDLGTSSEMAQDGDTLAPASEPDLISGLASGLSPLMSKVTSTLDSLSVTVASVNALLSSQNRDAISRTLAHLENTIADVSKIADGLGGRADKLNAFVDDLSELSDRFVNISEQADTLVGKVSSLVGTISENDIEELVTSFKELLESINDPEGTVGKLLVDDSVYDSLDALLSDVDSLVNKIQENPKKYLKISVF